ncbi:ATP-grasp domain-containing protein [Flavobacterium bizetiae]|uniref:ATP-grasp domain-containing protein n=1 Tax=Flavobacterium bizetiae TaxID=2704140 RepID=UPI0037568236
MQKILILGAGEMQVPIIKKSRDLEFYTIVVDFDKNALGFEYSDKKYLESTLDYDKVLEIAVENKIDGILTTSDLPVNVVANISKSLNLSAMSIDGAKLCTNKFLQRDFLNAKGVNMPNYKLIKDSEELNQFMIFPLVIKPVDSSASRGVKKVDSLLELKEQFLSSIQFSKEKKVIVEDYIYGREFSVETLTQNNITTVIAITEKLTKGIENGLFVEDTHIIPARITEDERLVIINEVIKAVDLIGLNNCPTHTEVKLNEKGVFIIEIACRLGGDFIASDLVPLSTGVDMLKNLINLSLGLKVDVNEKINKVAAVQFINVHNYKNALNFIDSHKSTIIRYEVKEFVNKLIENSMDRLGYILLQTDSIEEMTELLKKINN